jgi:ABC-type multidrug transport system fused ATPase/permease subunit
VVGPRGAQLSGGQRQRLAIARLILRDAPIWILDEFTSSLDPALEADLLETVRPLLAKKAVLLISHRLSTIRAADRIVVMQNGRIVGQGTHGALENTCLLYQSLMREQAVGRDITHVSQAVMA